MSNGETKDRSTQIIVAVIAAIAVIAAAIIGTMRGCEVPKPSLALEIKQPVSGNIVSATSKPNDAAAYFSGSWNIIRFSFQA